MRMRTRYAGVAAVLFAASSTAASAVSATTNPPTDDPSHGGKDRAWTVITPQIFAVPGPYVPPLPRCSAADITARARTRLIPGGVAGIVHLRGDRCSVHSKAGPDELRRGDATLAVDSTPWNKEADPPETPVEDTALGRGRVIWSFTWTGSWCGDAPTSVVVPLTKSSGEVMAPWHGPTPGCHANPTNTLSVLLPGPPAWPKTPDMVAGAGWSGLAARLTVPKVVHHAVLRHMSVTLTNSTSTDIALAPCPTYALAVGGKNFEGTAGRNGAPLPCPYQARVVPGHGAVTIQLPKSGFWDGPPKRHYHGRLHVRWAIDGVPEAAAHTRIRPSK